MPFNEHVQRAKYHFKEIHKTAPYVIDKQIIQLYKDSFCVAVSSYFVSLSIQLVISFLFVDFCCVCVCFFFHLVFRGNSEMRVLYLFPCSLFISLSLYLVSIHSFTNFLCLFVFFNVISSESKYRIHQVQTYQRVHDRKKTHIHSINTNIITHETVLHVMQQLRFDLSEYILHTHQLSPNDTSLFTSSIAISPHSSLIQLFAFIHIYNFFSRLFIHLLRLVWIMGHRQQYLITNCWLINFFFFLFLGKRIRHFAH